MRYSIPLTVSNHNAEERHEEDGSNIIIGTFSLGLKRVVKGITLRVPKRSRDGVLLSKTKNWIAE